MAGNVATAPTAGPGIGGADCVIIYHPLPAQLECPVCFTPRPRAGQRGTRVYAGIAGLSKHLKTAHPEMQKIFACSLCGFRPAPDKKAYGLKVVKNHWAGRHPGTVETPHIRQPRASNSAGKGAAAAADRTNVTVEERCSASPPRGGGATGPACPARSAPPSSPISSPPSNIVNTSPSPSSSSSKSPRRPGGGTGPEHTGLDVPVGTAPRADIHPGDSPPRTAAGAGVAPPKDRAESASAGARKVTTKRASGGSTRSSTTPPKTPAAGPNRKAANTTPAARTPAKGSPVNNTPKKRVLPARPPTTPSRSPRNRRSNPRSDAGDAPNTKRARAQAPPEPKKKSSPSGAPAAASGGTRSMRRVSSAGTIPPAKTTGALAPKRATRASSLPPPQPAPPQRPPPRPVTPEASYAEVTRGATPPTTTTITTTAAAGGNDTQPPRTTPSSAAALAAPTRGSPVLSPAAAAPDSPPTTTERNRPTTARVRTPAGGDDTRPPAAAGTRKRGRPRKSAAKEPPSAPESEAARRVRRRLDAALSAVAGEPAQPTASSAGPRSRPVEETRAGDDARGGATSPSGDIAPESRMRAIEEEPDDLGSDEEWTPVKRRKRGTPPRAKAVGSGVRRGKRHPTSPPGTPKTATPSPKRARQRRRGGTTPPVSPKTPGRGTPAMRARGAIPTSPAGRTVEPASHPFTAPALDGAGDCHHHHYVCGHCGAAAGADAPISAPATTDEGASTQRARPRGRDSAVRGRRQPVSDAPNTRTAVTRGVPTGRGRRGRGGRRANQRQVAEAHRGRVPASPSPPRREAERSRPITRRRAALSGNPKKVERERLVALADAVQSPEHLEELAQQMGKYFRDTVVGVRGGAGGTQSGRCGGRPQAVSERGGERPHLDRADNSRATGGFSGREERSRKAARIQHLYRTNRKRAVREVIQGPSPHCEVPRDTIEGHFRNIYAKRLVPGPLPVLPCDEPSASSTDILMRAFSREEVGRRLGRMKNSSPGPDGLTYGDLRKADPDAELLTAAFNACFRLERVPDAWKESNTVLIYKKGDRDDLSNWRPIAMGDVAPKLFAAVVADRLTTWAINNNRLCQAQKGFLPYEGCLEHNFVLQEVLADVTKRNREAVVAWLDLTNAFGSVPHGTIVGSLEGAGVPASLTHLVANLYEGCTTRVRTADGYTDRIPMLSGVRQGCPLSPVLFDLAIEPMVRGAMDSEGGYVLRGHKVTALAYADDIALVASSPASMERLLLAATETARLLGFAFNPRKCATLHTKGRDGAVRTGFSVQGDPVPSLGIGEPYEYLGIPTGFRVDQTPRETLRVMLGDIDAIEQSLLAPWQKLDAVRSFILPRLDFAFRGMTIEKKALSNADKSIKRMAKAVLNLPQRASAELVYLPPSKGGCGLLPLADLAEVTAVSHAFRMLNAGDTVVADLARSALEIAVREKIRRSPDERDLAMYLTGSLDGEMARQTTGGVSFWSRVRTVGSRLSARLDVEWVWSEARRELGLACTSSGGTRVTISPGAKASCLRHLKAAVVAGYEARLLRKPDQGKVFDVTSRSVVSNHFMRSGVGVRFADWRFVHRARLNVVPLNGALRSGTGDKRCRRCGYPRETLPHVLNHCGVHSAARQYRHDSLVHRLVGATRLPGEYWVNSRVPGVGGPEAALRPDIVVRHEPSRTVVVVDVTVAFENRFDAIEEARLHKIRKYQSLADSLRCRGYTVLVEAFVVGALGAWDPGNDAVLNLLRVSRRYAKTMRCLMTSETVAWSRDVYVEHVSGVRQYRVPGNNLDAEPAAVETLPMTPETTSSGVIVGRGSGGSSVASTSSATPAPAEDGVRETPNFDVNGNFNPSSLGLLRLAGALRFGTVQAQQPPAARAP